MAPTLVVWKYTTSKDLQLTQTVYMHHRPAIGLAKLFTGPAMVEIHGQQWTTNSLTKETQGHTNGTMERSTLGILSVFGTLNLRIRILIQYMLELKTLLFSAPPMAELHGMNSQVSVSKVRVLYGRLVQVACVYTPSF
jgi:hypothetical protein